MSKVHDSVNDDDNNDSKLTPHIYRLAIRFSFTTFNAHLQYMAESQRVL